ncbi:MAG TPA: hypothetical protein DEP28_06185 [Bacteroidetes bacterium]|nr:hypothetical protein [Bacteroidota bacterium]
MKYVSLGIKEALLSLNELLTEAYSTSSREDSSSVRRETSVSFKFRINIFSKLNREKLSKFES